ncbi:hypothetical protein ALT785_660017 [Alteromonas infernus]
MVLPKGLLFRHNDLSTLDISRKITGHNTADIINLQGIVSPFSPLKLEVNNTLKLVCINAKSALHIKN